VLRLNSNDGALCRFYRLKGEEIWVVPLTPTAEARVQGIAQGVPQDIESKHR
jgi:hypothetical protein